MSGDQCSKVATSTARRDSYVDIDIYGRGFDGVFGLGAEAVGRRTALARLKKSQDARSNKRMGSFVEYDLHGRGDPRIFGPDAHKVNAAQAQESLNRRGRGNRNKKSLRAILFPVKGKVKNAVKGFASRLSPKGKKSKESDAKVSTSSVSEKPEAKSPGVSAVVTSKENAGKTRDLTEFETTPIDSEESRRTSNKAENAVQKSAVGNVLNGSLEEVLEEEGPSPDVSEVNKWSSSSKSSANERDSRSYGEAEIIVIESESFNDIPEMLSVPYKSNYSLSSAGVSKDKEKGANSLKAANYWKRHSASGTASKDLSSNASSQGSQSTEQVAGNSSSNSSSSETTHESETSSEVVEVAAVDIFEAEPNGFLSQVGLEEQQQNPEARNAEPDTGETPLNRDDDCSSEIVSRTPDAKKALVNTDQSNGEREAEETEKHFSTEAANTTSHEAAHLQEKLEMQSRAFVEQGEPIVSKPSSSTSFYKSSGSVSGDLSFSTSVDPDSEVVLTESESTSKESCGRGQTEARTSEAEEPESKSFMSKNGSSRHDADQLTKSGADAEGSAGGGVRSSSAAGESASQLAKEIEEVAACRDNRQQDSISAGSNDTNVSESDGESFYDALDSVVDSDYSREAPTSSVVMTSTDASEMEGSEKNESSSSASKRLSETGASSRHSQEQSTEAVENASNSSGSHYSQIQSTVVEEGASSDDVFLPMLT